MTNTTNLSDNYDDLYYPSIQKAIAESYYNGESIGDIVSSIIKINEARVQIKYGLYQRTRLKKACKFDHDDPRKAQGVPIFAKKKIGATKVNNRLHTPFDRAIISTNSGYFAGVTPVITTSNEDADLEPYHLDSLIMEMTQASIGRGSGYSLLSAKDGEMYINPISDWSSAVIYDYVTKKPAFGVVYEKVLSNDTTQQPNKLDKYNVWFYEEKEVTTGTIQGATFIFKDKEPHGFNDIPLVEFPNNTERIGDVELTISLQDAYDIANSDLSSEISQLRLAYLLIKDEGLELTNEFVEKIQSTGALALGANGGASFIEKSLNSSPVENLKENLEESIYKYSLSYDPDKSRSGDVTAFQIQQSMTKMEESAIEREKIFKKSIMRIINMINFFEGLSSKSIGEFEGVQFSRNVPSNILNDLKLARESGLILDQETLADKAPFEIDYDLVKERLEEQKKSIIAQLDNESDMGIDE